MYVKICSGVIYRLGFVPAFFVFVIAISGCGDEKWPPEPSEVKPTSHVLAPEEALRSFYLPPGYGIELVASEPFVEAPVAIDFDADGRMYVAEMRSYMPDLDAEGERVANGRVSVLVDDDGDGRMDRRTVFLDSLMLPRAVKAVAGGVLIGAPPQLIFARDLDGDLRADERQIVSEDYGSIRSNPEYNPNGLIWGIDNCLHSAQHEFLYCWEDGELLRSDEINAVPTLFRGQWGASMDDFGRFYRNWNEDPLHVDLMPAAYYARNPYLARTRGAYEDIVHDDSVWPIRPNYGVNRGYRDNVLRADGTLAGFTAAGSPVVYRGDGFPSDVQGDVFITEPAGNFVRRFAVKESENRLIAHNAYDRAEFLTSSDERFRPVNLYSGPDGALYVVDMYRGVIQHTTYLTDYLKKHIRENGLQEPIGLGRIYRIVHEAMDSPMQPRLSTASTRELVEQLDHPNGWWRDTAQRLLVERQDTSEVSRLRKLASRADEPFTRLHALWTLDGLGMLSHHDLLAGFAADSPHVRAAAVRLSETRMDDPAIRSALDSLLTDPVTEVRRQLAASFGELPWPERAEALQRALAASISDSVVVDLVVSGLGGHEQTFIDRLAAERDSSYVDALAMLAAAQTNAANDGAANAVITPASSPEWAAAAIGRGIAMVAPASDEEEEGDAAIDAQGKELFEEVCGVCHGRNGMGMDEVAPKLVGSPWVTGSQQRLIRIVLDGKEGDQLMPPVQDLSDEEIAAVLTFVRRAWGNDASPVSADQVDMVREITSGRDTPWTEEELLDIR